jgi:hypothetical protein
MMRVQEQSVEKIEKPRHEGVPKTTKMGPIAHLFCEDVHWIDFTGNVLDCYCLVLNPFANQIFAKLNTMGHFQSHVVGPPDTGIIVIVDKSWFIDIRDWKTRFCKAKT